jgi:hypothetical protein
MISGAAAFHSGQSIVVKSAPPKTTAVKTTAVGLRHGRAIRDPDSPGSSSCDGGLGELGFQVILTHTAPTRQSSLVGAVPIGCS